jgi:hypothetical protein
MPFLFFVFTAQLSFDAPLVPFIRARLFEPLTMAVSNERISHQSVSRLTSALCPMACAFSDSL